jgi:uncharacterized protein (DUF2236 family)
VLEGYPAAPPAGRPGDPGRFPPGTVARRVNAERALILAGGRALLMQLAHPKVAAGVADHSGFPADTFPRLWRTLDTMLLISFGDAERSAAAADRVNAVHERVRGHRGNERYHALDPELLLWVHATIVDSTIVGYERFVGRLPPSARARYQREMHGVATALRVPPDRLPNDLGAFEAYVRTTVEGLVVSDEARRLAADVLDPLGPAVPGPAAALFRLCTVGLLPPPLRDAYGLAWDARRQRLLDAVSAASRLVHPILPGSLRRWPHAREADRRLVSRRPPASPTL